MEKYHHTEKLTAQRKNRIRAAAAFILGAGLLAAWLLTGQSGISGEDKSIYEEAMALQEQVDTLGFRDFRLADYPVAMYDGTRDYVFYQGEVKKRTPVLETFAGTAYPVEDHFEVVIPTLAQFDKLLSLVGGVEGMITGSGYGPAEHKATIWHEAFHAYQLTHYAILGEKLTPEEMRGELEAGSRDNAEENAQAGNGNAKEDVQTANGKADGRENFSEEEWIVNEVDKKEEIRKKLEAEIKLLEHAVQLSLELENGDEDQEHASGIAELKEILADYEKSRRQRLAELPEEAAEAEIRCELTEGTAYYIESKVYEMLSGEEKYKEHYLDRIGVFEGGRGKYYRTGMAKCLLLDRLAPDWKDRFDFTEELPVAALLYVILPYYFRFYHINIRIYSPDFGICFESAVHYNIIIL